MHLHFTLDTKIEFYALAAVREIHRGSEGPALVPELLVGVNPQE